MYLSYLIKFYLGSFHVEENKTKQQQWRPLEKKKGARTICIYHGERERERERERECVCVCERERERARRLESTSSEME